jgi:hypothetical protein
VILNLEEYPTNQIISDLPDNRSVSMEVNWNSPSNNSARLKKQCFECAGLPQQTKRACMDNLKFGFSLGLFTCSNKTAKNKRSFK